MKIWKAQKRPIVVGMRLDDLENRMLQSAMSLAKKLESSVELVHCLESAIGYSSSGEVLPKATHPTSMPQQAGREERAKANLMALGRAADEQREIHVRVERGDPAENLARVAREVGAGLIVCGLQDQRQSWAFQGLSTALSLAFYAPVPVLILPLSETIDFTRPLGILISDSLGGEGWHVLESGLQLARYLNCDATWHAHILKANAIDMDNTLRDMGESARQGRMLTRDDLQQTLLQKIHEELFYRFHNTSCCKDLMSRYHPLASIGDVDSEVNRIMRESGSQLVIMGRHQFYSNRRLALDHIPYQALMERKAGMLVIPDEWESRSNADKDVSQIPQMAN